MAFLKSTIFAATIACLATTIQIAHAEVLGNNDYMLSDDRVRSLDITPVLGRGYSRSTNKFLSTCLNSLEAAETTAPAFNYDREYSCHAMLC